MSRSGSRRLLAALCHFATRDGVPVCAHCGELMVEIDEDFWQCPAAGAELDAAIDQLLRLFAEQLPDLPGDP